MHYWLIFEAIITNVCNDAKNLRNNDEEKNTKFDIEKE